MVRDFLEGNPPDPLKNLAPSTLAGITVPPQVLEAGPATARNVSVSRGGISKHFKRLGPRHLLECYGKD